MTKMALFPSVLALALIGYFGASYAAPAQNDANCTACHSNIGTLHTGSKHANLPCATCHDGTADHLKNPKTHPTVSMSPQQCRAATRINSKRCTRLTIIVSLEIPRRI